MRKSGFGMTCLMLSLLVPACVPVADSEGEVEGSEDVGEAQQAVVASGLTAEASTSSALESKEHCLVPPSVYDAVGAGSQVRLTRTVVDPQGNSVTHLALCTVKGKTTSSTKLLMRQRGLEERLGATAGQSSITGVTASTLGSGLAVASSASTITASYSGISQTIKEYSTRPSMTKVVYMAPHGRIEGGTAEQVDHIEALPGIQAFWTVGLHTTAGTIGKHLHITSADISEVSFPGLATFVDAPMRYAVSFHGFDDDEDRSTDNNGDGVFNDDDFPFDEDVLVGGSEDLSFRRGVAELIAEALEGTGFTARHDLDPEVYSDYRGVDPLNVVNRAALLDNGLQLEQSLSLREHATAPLLVAEAVKTVYDCITDAEDAYLVGTGTLASNGTGYLDTRLCPRFIAQFNLPSAGSVTVDGGKPAGCSPGRVHVDVYTLDSDNSWTRVGGGFRTYGAGCVGTDEPGFEVPPPIVTPANVRVVVRSLTAAGAPDVAAATVQ